MPLARRLTACLALAGALVLGSAAAASADEDDWTITRYDVAAEIGPDGAAEVTINLDFDFGPDDDAHGPYLSIVERQEIEGDPDRYRVLEVSDIEVSSSTGAPTDLLVEREDGFVVVRVGDEDVEIGGVQSYSVSYRLDSLSTPGETPDAPDAVVWNAVGLGWEVPLENVTVRLVAPEPVTSLECVAGGVGSTQICDGATVQGDAGVTVTESRLEPGQGLTVAAVYPAGTFPDAAVAYAPRRTWGNTFALTPVTGAVGGVAAVGGVGAVLVARRRRRDADPAAPGFLESSGGAVPEGFRTEPPADVPAGEFGTLIDERAQTHDVVAVLLDLAVRGVIHIEVVPATDEDEDETGDAGATDDPEDELQEGETDGDLVDPEDLDSDDRDFQVIRVPGPHDLRPYESTLVEGIFGDASTVVVSRASTEIAAALTRARLDLDTEVTERGWFAGSPRKVRTRWFLAGAGLILAGLAATLALGLTVGWGLVGLAVLVVGVAAVAVAPSMPTRTARGSELTVQAREFERFLTDVTSQTPTWAAGTERLVPSVFETYLPYAVALRLEKRWTDAFAGAVQRGELAQPAWFTSPAYLAYPGVWAMGDLSRSLGDLTSGVSATTVAAATGLGSGSSASWSGSVGGGAGGGGGGGW